MQDKYTAKIIFNKSDYILIQASELQELIICSITLMDNNKQYMSGTIMDNNSGKIVYSSSKKQHCAISN